MKLKSLAAATAAGIFVLGGVAAPAQAAGSPSLTASQAGTTDTTVKVAVSGTGWAPNTTATVTVPNQQAPGSATVNATGVLTGLVNVLPVGCGVSCTVTVTVRDGVVTKTVPAVITPYSGAGKSE